MHRIIWMIMITATLCGGCSSPGTQHLLPLPAQQQTSKTIEYRIQPGDKLEIKFFYNPALNESVIVRPDGRISLQLLDEVIAAELTPAQLDAILTTAYSHEFNDPSITVIVRNANPLNQQVYVGGEVKKPGPVQLAHNMTPLEAVLNAEGLLDTAKPEEVIVIRKNTMQKPVPYRVNLEDAMYGKQPSASFKLQAYDIVYIPKSKIANANVFVRQYVEDLFLFRGFNIGFPIFQ